MTEEDRLMEVPICPVCGMPMDSDQDSKGTVTLDGKRICAKCGLKAIGLDEDTELFIDYPESEDGDTEEEQGEGEETESESEEESEIDKEPEDDSEDMTDEEPSETPQDEEGPTDDDEHQPTDENATEAKSDSVADKLLDETHDEIHQDVKWFRKKAKERIADDPDSFRERWRRARLMRQGHVILRTLSRDSDTGDVICESTLVRIEDLPRAAVPCTKEKGIYCHDTIKTSQWYQATREQLNFDPFEAQFTASDAALYMMSNKIDNALITKWTDFSHMDMKKIFIGAGLAILIVIYFVIKSL